MSGRQSDADFLAECLRGIAIETTAYGWHKANLGATVDDALVDCLNAIGADLERMAATLARGMRP